MSKNIQTALLDRRIEVMKGQLAKESIRRFLIGLGFDANSMHIDFLIYFEGKEMQLTANTDNDKSTYTVLPAGTTFYAFHKILSVIGYNVEATVNPADFKTHYTRLTSEGIFCRPQK